MGRVYKGYDETPGTAGGIKVINRTLTDDRDYMESFHHEAKLLAKITHPNIALIYYFGNLEGILFLYGVPAGRFSGKCPAAENQARAGGRRLLYAAGGQWAQ